MPLTRKQTAWKKSRKFGDVKGGRKLPKLADNIFNRQHNLQPPSKSDMTPLYIQDNPSKDFFFPVSIKDIEQLLHKLPDDHTQNLTHIWLKRMDKKSYLDTAPQGMFICGSGVSLIVLREPLKTKPQTREMV